MKGWPSTGLRSAKCMAPVFDTADRSQRRVRTTRAIQSADAFTGVGALSISALRLFQTVAQVAQLRD